jgi:hypothetical protein
MQICVALHYVDLNYDICVCLLNYVMNLTTVDHFADNSFEYLILLNAYKCVNVVCADATRCNLECPIEEHFFYPTLALQFGASSEKNIQGLLEMLIAGMGRSTYFFCFVLSSVSVSFFSITFYAYFFSFLFCFYSK